MKNKNPKQQMVKRSAAANMIGVGTRTLRRYETAGLLTPIKPNCRMVLYDLAEVQRIQTGEVQTTVSQPEAAAPNRAAGGTFAPQIQRGAGRE